MVEQAIGIVERDRIINNVIATNSWGENADNMVEFQIPFESENLSLIKLTNVMTAN